MDLFVNDLSVRQQFHDITSFHEALLRLMKEMLPSAKRHGRRVYCNREFMWIEPVPGVPMPQAIKDLSKEEKNAVLSWLTRDGPFWDGVDGVRKHGDDDYFECNGEVVTDTAVGEAAFRFLNSMDCGLVSLSPTGWEFSPVEVIWRGRTEDLGDKYEPVMLENWWDAKTLNCDLEDVAPPITSWNELRNAANRFENLIFSEDCFSPLDGTPFAKASSNRFLSLFGILDRLAGAFEADGRRTAEGHKIYQAHFTGDRASFSDSSDSEKNDFRQKLTFNDPDNPGHSLVCPWHGKESHSMLRLHFSWPITAGKPVYVVYAGPKITRR